MRDDARNRWEAENTTKITIKFNNRTDADILAALAAASSKAGMIKAAIREYAKSRD